MPLPEPKKKRTPITWQTVKDIALAFPNAAESTSYGTAAIKVDDKLFVRLRKEGDAIVVRIEKADRALRMEADPGTFFVTDHYVAFPYVLVKLSKVKRDDLEELLNDAWRIVSE